MKVRCDGLSLSDAISKVAKALNTHQNNPVLECIKIKTFEDCLIFTATDEEICIEKRIKAEVMIEGELLVYGKYFSDFARTLANENEVEMTLTPQNQLKIFYGGGVAEFACNFSLLFPTAEFSGEEESFSIIKKELKDLISKVSFSVATDDARPVLRGVLLEIEEYNINAVALDGFRMAIAKKALERNQAAVNLLINARCLNEINKLIDDSEDIISIYIKRNYILVDLDHTRITVRIMAGDFINYRQIISRNYVCNAVVSRGALEKIIDRANLIARVDRNNLVRFTFSDKTLEVVAKTDINYSSEKVDITYDGRDMNVAFNSKYMLDIMRAVEDDFIKFKLSGETGPCVITPVDENDEYMYFILPVKV